MYGCIYECIDAWGNAWVHGGMYGCMGNAWVRRGMHGCMGTAWVHGKCMGAWGMHRWNGLEDGYGSVDGEGRWVQCVTRWMGRWVDRCKGGCTGERVDVWVDE